MCKEVCEFDSMIGTKDEVVLLSLETLQVVRLRILFSTFVVILILWSVFFDFVLFFFCFFVNTSLKRGSVHLAIMKENVFFCNLIL